MDKSEKPQQHKPVFSMDEGINADWIKFARPTSPGWQRTDAEIMRMYGMTLEELQAMPSYTPESERLGRNRD